MAVAVQESVNEFGISLRTQQLIYEVLGITDVVEPPEVDVQVENG